MRVKLPVALALIAAIIFCLFLAASTPLVPDIYDVTVYNGGRPVLHIENASYMGTTVGGLSQFDSDGKRYLLSTDGLVAVRNK